MKTTPDRRVYMRAMGSRMGALQVLIKRRKGWVSMGSGFVINDKCRMPLALTCEHVVKPRRTGDMVLVRRMMQGGVEEFNALVLQTDPVRDIALLGIPGLRPPHTHLSSSLTLAPVANASDCAIAVGYCNPERLFNKSACSRLPAVSPGCIRGMYYDSPKGGVDNMITIFDSAITLGMSGSPAVARDGVVGMCTSICISPGAETAAVSSNTILQVLKGWLDNGTVNEEGLHDLNL